MAVKYAIKDILTYPCFKTVRASSSLKLFIWGFISLYPSMILSNTFFTFISSSSTFDLSPLASVLPEFSGKDRQLGNVSSGFGNDKFKHSLGFPRVKLWPLRVELWPLLTSDDDELLLLFWEVSRLIRFISSMARALSVAVYRPWRIPVWNHKRIMAMFKTRVSLYCKTEKNLHYKEK